MSRAYCVSQGLGFGDGVTAAAGGTHVIAVSLRSTESVFTNAGWIWPVGHHVTPDLESGEAGGLGTGNVKMNKPGVEVRGICCPYGLVSPAHQPR